MKKAVKMPPGKCIVVTPELAETIDTAVLDAKDKRHLDDPDCKEGGFQRKRFTDKVNQIAKYADYAKTGIVFGPPLVARIDGKLYYVDGQHRGAGHIAAGVPFYAYVVDMTWRQAMDNFIVHDSTATRVPRAQLLGGSRALSGIKIKKLALKLGVSQNCVDAIVTGLLAGISSHGANIQPGGDIDDDVMRRAEAILVLWAGGKL